MAVGAALAWALWFAWMLTPWIPIRGLLPLDTVVAFPAALLLTAGAILLATGSRPERAPADAQRLHRQAARAGVASVSLWAFLAATYLVPLDGITPALAPAALAGAVLLAALARRASKDARAAGDRSLAVHAMTSTVAVIGLTVALVLLLGVLALLWLMRASTF